MSEIEQYECKSYINDDLEVQDCTCGKCGYSMNVKKWKEAYQEIVRVCKKYPEFRKRYEHSFSDIETMLYSAKDHLILIDWYEKYGLKLSHDCKPYSSRNINIDNYMHFTHFYDAGQDKSAGSGYFISWSDDGRQPKDEWLMVISFSTGAYIFGKDYNGQKQLFQDFFDELKSYKPDYIDSANKSLYWRLENAVPMFTDFRRILNKYNEQNTKELKQREANALREKLKKIEAEL